MNTRSGARRARFSVISIRMLGGAALLGLVALTGCQVSGPTAQAEPTVTFAPQPSSSPSEPNPGNPDESRDANDPGDQPTTATPEPTQSSAQPSTTKPTTKPAQTSQQPKVPGAYPGAGGSAPSGTIQLKPSSPGSPATIKTPTGNIGCDLAGDFAGCGVHSLSSSGKLGSDEGGPKWWVTLFDSEYTTVPVIGSKGDLPYFDDPSSNPLVLTYGTAAQYGDTVCASQSTGLTCWSLSTGRGAFMNSETITLF